MYDDSGKSFLPIPYPWYHYYSGVKEIIIITIVMILEQLFFKVPKAFRTLKIFKTSFALDT